jgi:hypothetical protein
MRFLKTLSLVKQISGAPLVYGLCLVFASAPAKADVFEFNFGPDVSGTFTTGAASSVDPGYELITGLTFTTFNPPNLKVIPPPGNWVASHFQPDAAFNPSTDAFINHAGGKTVDDIGGFGITSVKNGLIKGIINGSSFEETSGSIDGRIAVRAYVEAFSVEAPLEISKSLTPIPEPSTWAMMLLGLAGLGLTAFRTKPSWNPFIAADRE